MPTWSLEVTDHSAGHRTAPPRPPETDETSPFSGVVSPVATGAGGDPERADAINWLAVCAGVRSGDADSVRVFYEAHFDWLLVRAKRLMGRDEATCLDLVQTALLKAIRGMPLMQNGARLERWLQVVLKTTAWDWLRRERRRREAPVPADEALREPADAADNGLSAIEDAARLAWIEEQLDQTEPELRQLLSLRYRLGWTLQRIARHCGLKTGAVDGRLRRAVQHFREQAQRDFPP